MRFILKLKAIKEKEFTYNYNFPLSNEINKLMGFSSPDFLDFLASKEIKLPGKSFNLFSFALSFENVYRRGRKLYLRSNNASLTISVPSVLDEFINEKVLNDISGKNIAILKNYPNAILDIKHYEVLPEPEIDEEVSFKPLSPLVMSSRMMIGQKSVFTSYTYKDDLNDISKHITDNLVYKHKILYNENIHAGKLRFEWDNDYVEERLRSGKKLIAKLSIEFGTKKNTVLGNVAPFTIKGNKKLIKVGYECGFGDMNSFGFGTVDIIS